MRGLLLALLVFSVAGAFGGSWTKSDLDNTVVYSTVATYDSAYRMPEDWEWNSGGTIDIVPTLGGSASGWGTYFITTVENDTGENILLTEFGFPCGGPGTVDWILWYDVGGINPPSGGAGTADETGEFDPVSDDPDQFPPTTYTYVDLTGENLLIEDGAFVCFGYENPGMGGQISYNGTQTWAWYSGYWDPDQDWGRTAILQIKGNYGEPDEEDPTITNQYPVDADYPSGVPPEENFAGCHWEDGDPETNSGIDVDASSFDVYDSNMDLVGGMLDIDDSDEYDVIVDFEADDPWEEGATYTVETETFDNAGNSATDSWTFDVGYTNIAESSFGAIKAGFAQ
jgi:hypothetical protein